MDDEQFFLLKIHKTDGSSMTYRFAQEATLGSDPRNDIILFAPQITPQYLAFKNKDTILSMTFLGRDETATLNQVKLLKNRMYILEKKDIIHIGLIEITIL